MTPEELSEVRLAQIRELERENTALRVRLVTEARGYGLLHGALRVLVDIRDQIASAGSPEARALAIEDMKKSLEAAERLLGRS